MLFLSANGAHRKERPETSAVPVIEPLAPRILYSADVAALATPIAPIDGAIDAVWSQPVEAALLSTQAQAQAQSQSSLVVIDEALDDLDSLLNYLESERAQGANIEWMLIDAQTDGVEAVAQYLSNANTTYDAVHVFSHGSEAQFALGSAVINPQGLAEHADSFESWANGLTESADILIYACDVSATEQGRTLANNLAALTGADIATSDDVSGHLDLNGDWSLEFSSGIVDTNSLVQSNLADNWLTTLELVPAAGDVLVVQNETGNESLPNNTGGSQIATNGTTTIVVWEGSDETVFQRFDVNGNPLHGVDQVVQNDDNISRSKQTVAMMDNGDFVIVWTAQGGQDGNGNGIFAQLFNADGTPKPRPSDAYTTNYSNSFEFRVNAFTIGNQDRASVAIASDGKFVIAWDGPVPFSFSDGVRYAVFNADGRRLTIEDSASTDASSNEARPSLAVNPSDGSMMIAFEHPQGSGDEIQLLRLSATGQKIGGLIDVAVPGQDLSNPSISIADNGMAYLVAVAGNSGGGPGSGGEDILMWVIGTDNTVSGTSPIQVNAVTGDEVRNPEVIAQDNNTVMVAWDTRQDADQRDVAARQFDGSGQALNAEIRANAYTNNTQHHPSLAVQDNKAFVAWSGEGLADNQDVFFRVLNISEPGVTVTPSGNQTSEAGASVNLSIVLTSQPTGVVTVDFASSDTTEGSLPIASINFDSGNWDTPRIVTVQGVDDAVVDSDVPYSVTVSISSGVDPIYNGLADISVALSNLDDDLPSLADISAVSDNDLAANQVAENSIAGTVVGVTALAIDTDPGDSVSYSITGSGNAFFQIDSVSGVVTTVNGNLDFESKTDHEVRILATSSDTSTSEQTITINVLDENDVTPIINAGQSFTIDENSPNGALVGTPAITDPDTVGSPQNWAITGGTGAAVFAVSPGTGQLSVIDPNALDFESTPSLTLLVTVSDGVNTSNAETLTINLSDLNELPLGGDATSTATEDTDYVFSSADFILADPDAGDSLSAVRIESLPGSGILLLRSLAFDGSTVLPVEVTAAELANGDLVYRPLADLNGTALTTFGLRVLDHANSASVVRTQTIDVTPVNDAPELNSDDGAGNSAITLAENNAAVGTVSGTDAEGGPLTFFLSSPDATEFSIGLNSGVITFNAAPDFETPTDTNTDNVYQLIITAQDDQGAPTAQPINLSVTVTDLNDVTPVIDAGQSFTIDENAANGVVIGTPAVTDPDTVGSPLNWAITGGTGAAVFAVAPGTDQLSVIDPSALDFESTPSLTLLVTVSDGVNTSNAETLTINLTDLNEMPLGGNGTSTTLEDTDLAFNSADFAFADPDSGDNLAAIRITSLPDSGVLMLNGSTLNGSTTLPISIPSLDLDAGALVYRPGANASGVGLTGFDYSVIDSTGLASAISTRTFNVTPVNDAPVISGSQTLNAGFGEQAIIDLAALVATDPEDSASQLIFTVDAAPRLGALRLSGSTLGPGDTFTQADIDAGQLRYEGQSAVDAQDTLTVTVRDSAGASSGSVVLVINASGIPAAAPPSEQSSSDSGSTDRSDEASDESNDNTEGETDEELNRGQFTQNSPPAHYGNNNNRSTQSVLPEGQQSNENSARQPSHLDQRAGSNGYWQSSEDGYKDPSRGVDQTKLDNGSYLDNYQRGRSDRLISDFSQLDLHKMSELIGEDSSRSFRLNQQVNASGVALSTGMSLGYVVWLLRSGALLSSVLASMPAWRSIDPLPILSSLPGNRGADDDESLEEMLEKAPERSQLKQSDRLDSDGRPS